MKTATKTKRLQTVKVACVDKTLVLGVLQIGNQYKTYSIVTTEANELMAKIHNTKKECLYA